MQAVATNIPYHPISLDVAVIGGGLIVLHGDYTEAQMWLPFMQGVILTRAPRDTVPEPSPLKPEEAKKRVANRVKKKLIEPGVEHKRLYLPMAGQYSLPFPEFKKLANHEQWDRVSAGWDHFQPPPFKDRRRKPPPPKNYSWPVRLAKEEREQWLSQLRGRYNEWGLISVYFEYYSDWLLAKLTFPEKQIKQ
jgi:hypothetical protein